MTLWNFNDSWISTYNYKYQRLKREPSDHQPISIELDFSNFSPGAGLWKLPTSLLYDQDCIN